jgi:hypothetical protein
MLVQERKNHLIHDSRTVLLNRMTLGGRQGFDLSDGIDHFVRVSMTKAYKRVKMNYRFRCGRVAQLGEHLLCKQGVTGSIPVTSTNFFKVEFIPC